MAQPGDGNEPSMSVKEPSVLVSKLRATITEMLKEASGDHKANKGKRVRIQKVGSTHVSLG